MAVATKLTASVHAPVVLLLHWNVAHAERAVQMVARVWDAATAGNAKGKF